MFIATFSREAGIKIKRTQVNGPTCHLLTCFVFIWQFDAVFNGLICNFQLTKCLKYIYIFNFFERLNKSLNKDKPTVRITVPKIEGKKCIHIAMFFFPPDVHDFYNSLYLRD